MSIKTIQYIGYGYLLDYNSVYDLLDKKLADQLDAFETQYFDSGFTQDIREVNGCSFISDHSSSKFAFFGKLFAKSTSEPLDTQQIPCVGDGIKYHVQNEIINVFGTDFCATPNLFLLTIYR